MKNKYLLIIMAALMVVLWYYIGALEFFDIGQGEGFSEDWWFGALLAVALGAGNTGGDDAVSILKEAIVGYVPTMVKIGLLAIIGSLVWDLLVIKIPFDAVRQVAIIGSFVISATLVNATVSYLKKA